MRRLRNSTLSATAATERRVGLIIEAVAARTDCSCTFGATLGGTYLRRLRACARARACVFAHGVLVRVLRVQRDRVGVHRCGARSRYRRRRLRAERLYRIGFQRTCVARTALPGCGGSGAAQSGARRRHHRQGHMRTHRHTRTRARPPAHARSHRHTHTRGRTQAHPRTRTGSRDLRRHAQQLQLDLVGRSLKELVREACSRPRRLRCVAAHDTAVATHAALQHAVPVAPCHVQYAADGARTHSERRTGVSPGRIASCTPSRRSPRPTHSRSARTAACARPACVSASVCERTCDQQPCAVVS